MTEKKVNELVDALLEGEQVEPTLQEVKEKVAQRSKAKQGRLDEPSQAEVKKTIGKLKKLSTSLKKAVFGRDKMVDALVLSLATNQHILIIGTHGEAKSLVARKLAEYSGLNAYVTQLHNETQKKDILGMIDPVKFNKGEYGLIKTKFWDAHVHFYDEFLRGRTEFIDILLEVLQERKCSKTVLGEQDLPVVSVICTSNPLTDDYNTERMDLALKDRFNIILEIEHLIGSAPAQVKRVLDEHNEEDLTNGHVKLTLEELRVIPKYARRHVSVNTGIIKDMFDVLHRDKFDFSTRFIKRFKETLQVYSLLMGRSETVEKDYYEISHLLLVNRQNGLTPAKIRDAVGEALAYIEFDGFNDSVDKLKAKKGYDYVKKYVELAYANKGITDALPQKLQKKWESAKEQFKEEFGYATKDVARDFKLLEKMQTEAFREFLDQLAENRSVKTPYLSESDSKKFKEIYKQIDPKGQFFEVEANDTTADYKGTKVKKTQFWILPRTDAVESFEKVKSLRLKAKPFMSKY